MKHYAVGIALFVAITPTIASGWSDLSGTNSKGELIYIDPAWEADPGSKDFSIPENMELYSVRIHKDGSTESMPDKYKDQRCKLTKKQFSCEKSGKSPFSGVTYKIVPNKNPRDCSYESKYICIAGCNSVAPHTMFKSHWECYE